MIALRGINRASAPLALVAVCSATTAIADGTVADRAIAGFAAHCFDPRLTADRVTELLHPTGARVDYYDLDPFLTVPASPALGRAATDGTDRRCELAFDGDHADRAAEAALAALAAEGIDTPADIPASHGATPGTVLLGARQLNPVRVAVVHVGTRPGPNGIETFLNVERLMPSAN